MGEYPSPQIISVEETILISEWLLSQSGYQMRQSPRGRKGTGKKRAALSRVIPNKYKLTPFRVHRLHCSGYTSALESCSRVSHSSNTYLLDWANYLPALHLYFLICKMRTVTVPSPKGYRVA